MEKSFVYKGTLREPGGQNKTRASWKRVPLNKNIKEAVILSWL